MKLYHLFDLFRLFRTQWKSPREIRKTQNSKLSKLVRHAYQKVPYYRDLFDSNQIKPEDIRSLDQLQIVPLTSKKQLQKLPLKSKISDDIDPGQCKSFITSGTTGIPLKVYYTPGDWTLINLGLVRAFVAMGMNPMHRMATFSGKQNINQKKSWYEMLGIWKGIDISTWTKPEEWVNVIRKWQPQVLIGYVMTLKLLAEAIQKEKVDGVNPRMVISGSGVLDEFSRRFLKSVFHCKIVDFYGSFEAGGIAWECEKCSGYHISSDTVIVEILKEGKPVSPGEEGEVVITNLHSYAMPFIRYRQEDLVILSNKNPICGRGLPLLHHIQGRKDDCIILRSGRKVPSQPFYYSIEPVPGINRWSVIQETIDNLKIEIESNSTFSIDSLQKIRNSLKQFLGDEIEIQICLVDSIPINTLSKFRMVSSKLTN